MGLKHTADIKSLAYVAICLGLQIYAILATPSILVLQIILFGALCFFTFACCIITHNQMHTPIFEGPQANRIFQLLLSCAKGHTTTTVVIPHNFNHHPFVGGAQDWSRPSLAENSRGIFRLFKYLKSASREMGRERLKETSPQPSEKDRRFWKFESRILIAYGLLLFLLNWKAALVFIFIPWIIAISFLLTVNFLQHDGCDFSSPQTASRNFVSPLGNWLLFNNGFHTIHHLQPQLHWSETPAAHAKVLSESVPKELQVHSLWKFIFVNYIFTRGRSQNQLQG